MADDRDFATKIGILFKPMLNEAITEMKRAAEADHNNTINSVGKIITAETHEVLVELNKLNIKLDAFEKIIDGIKKGVPKPVATKAPAGTATAGTPPVAAAPPKVTCPNNRMVYFKNQYRLNEEYRKKYTDADLAKIIAEDATVASKPDDAKKVSAMSILAWTYIKDKRPDMLATIDQEYTELKRANDMANKPPQQTPDAHTPVAPATVGQ